MFVNIVVIELEDVLVAGRFFFFLRVDLIFIFIDVVCVRVRLDVGLVRVDLAFRQADRIVEDPV